MATNDFLVFGGGAGANVITQVTYSGLAARTAGFSAGVAQSAQLNKVWRQSSIMSAVLAQFVADLSGQDVLDDGTTATILTNLKAAVGAQSVAVVGTMRNARMSVAPASASATFTADEIIVESALGGRAYRLASFSKTVNLGTTGAGGMDAGAAPASGYVALYAIYNPATGASALLATNATAAAQPEVYGGANMPVGYTASALVSVWPTNASGQFMAGYQQDRFVSANPTTALSTSVGQSSPTALSIAGSVPRNARTCSGNMQMGSTAASTVNIGVYPTAGSFGTQGNLAAIAANGSISQPFNKIPMSAAQTIYYIATNTAGTPTYQIFVAGYEF